MILILKNVEIVLTMQFPISLKRSDVTLVHRNEDSWGKSSFCAVIALPLFSKVYQRVIDGQLSVVFGKHIQLTIACFAHHKDDNWNLIILEWMELFW